MVPLSAPSLRARALWYDSPLPAFMQVYFSHSYRDKKINSYFLTHLKAEGLPLLADQKTDIWCVAKLERYMWEMTGVVSVISRRPTERDAAAYSDYIGHELSLARRARVPRLLFVDEEVWKRHKLAFPPDAVTFHSDAPEEGLPLHADALHMFIANIEGARARPREGEGRAIVIADQTKKGRAAADDVAEILRREDFDVTVLAKRHQERGLNDIRLLEALWRAELGVFLIGERLSEAHIALAMAHAHCLPAIRLQYDDASKDCNPSVTGVIRWSAPEDMLVELSRQLGSYRKGLVVPVDVEELGTMRWQPKPENLWRVDDGPALLNHVRPEHAFVQDEVSRVRSVIKTALGRIIDKEGCLDLCRRFYDALRRFSIGYELEQRSTEPGMQGIRTPRNIETHRTATCIDLVCLFASLLEAAGQYPLLVVVERPGLSHALAGYRVPSEVGWATSDLGDVRAATARGDAVFFEATGVAQSDQPVGLETADERRDKLLLFTDAVEVAKRTMAADGVRLRHFVDVRMLRTRLGAV